MRINYEAERLDAEFGDPTERHNPYGFEAIVARDERGAFPDTLCAAARKAHLHTVFLPSDLGGSLRSFDHALTLVRTAARRDLAVMPGTMFSISAAMAVLVGGSPEQQRQIAYLIVRGGSIGFALSERHAGSDVMAGTCRLEPDGSGGSGGFRLTGEKWMVGLGERCDALFVLGRTGERGPGAFTAVLLDRAALPPGAAEPSEPVRTSGMRGIDFTDYSFRDCPVPRDAVVGEVGTGLDTALRAQQVVRMMSAAGNLGCADTALRTVLDFANERTVGRKRLLDTQPARRELALAAAAMLAVDVTAITAARSLHVAPQHFVVPASVVKRIATEESEALIDRCAAVLGARSVIAAGPTGIVAKAKRDNAIVRVIDTSPVGNLRTIAAQVPLISNGPVANGQGANGPAATAGNGHRPGTDRTEQIFDLDRELPDFAPAELDLTTRGHDYVVATLPMVAGQARAVLADADDRAGRRAAELIGDLEAELRALPGGHGDPLDTAERFCDLYAAAACVHLWWFNRAEPLYGQPPGSAGWLAGCLAYLLARARRTDVRHAAEDAAGALEAVLDLHARGRLFSVVPVRLAGPAAKRGLHPAEQPDLAEPAQAAGAAAADVAAGTPAEIAADIAAQRLAAIAGQRQGG